MAATYYPSSPAASAEFANSIGNSLSVCNFLVNSGWIHTLKEDDGKVTAVKPVACSEGDTYLDAVEDVLGVKAWYDPETESLLEQFRAERDKVLEDPSADLKAVKALAASIGSRSDSLRDMMGKEMRQLGKLVDGS